MKDPRKPGFQYLEDSFGFGHLVLKVLEYIYTYSNLHLELVQNGPKGFRK